MNKKSQAAPKTEKKNRLIWADLANDREPSFKINLSKLSRQRFLFFNTKVSLSLLPAHPRGGSA